LLKDEIKKPYFISLKKFLWEEGVKGAEDTPKSVKVYPPRELYCSGLITHHEIICFTAKHIYAWSDTPLGKVKVVILGQGEYY